MVNIMIISGLNDSCMIITEMQNYKYIPEEKSDL